MGVPAARLLQAFFSPKLINARNIVWHGFATPVEATRKPDVSRISKGLPKRRRRRRKKRTNGEKLTQSLPWHWPQQPRP